MHSLLIFQALMSPFKRVVWVLLLWEADYLGGLVGFAGSQPGWLPGSAKLSAVCCQMKRQLLTVEL